MPELSKFLQKFSEEIWLDIRLEQQIYSADEGEMIWVTVPGQFEHIVSFLLFLIIIF